MKRFLKIAAISITFLLLIVGICGIIFYRNLSTKWKKLYSEADIKSIVAEIEKTPPLKPLVYSIYDNLNGNARHNSIYEVYLKNLLSFGTRRETCWYENAAITLPTVKFALQKYTTPEKCFDFTMARDFEDLKRYRSNCYNFPKSIIELSDTTEILTFLVVAERPAYYCRQKEKLAARVEALKTRLQQNHEY